MESVAGVGALIGFGCLWLAASVFGLLVSLQSTVRHRIEPSN
jgi:hypothetical protein